MRDHAFEISGFGGRFGDSQSNQTMQVAEVATRSDEDDSTTTLRLPVPTCSLHNSACSTLNACGLPVLHLVVEPVMSVTRFLDYKVAKILPEGTEK